MRQFLSAANQGDPNDLGSTHRSCFIAWFTLAMTLGWVTSLWIHRFIPSTNYPLWIHMGQIFSQLITKQAASCYSIVHWPVPNAVFVFTIGVLDLFLNPETSGKVFLSSYIALFALGSYRLVGSMTTRRDSPLLLLPLLYISNRYVLVGEISFSFGLGVLFLAIAYVLVPRDRALGGHLAIVAGFSLLIFFSHAVAYFCWLIFLTLLAVFDSSRFPRLKALAAISPSLILMALYILHRHLPHGATGSSASWFIDILLRTPMFFSLFSPLHFFDPFYYSDPMWLRLLALVFNCSAVMTVVTLAGVWLRNLISGRRWSASQNGTARAVLAAPPIFFAMFLVVPFSMVTGVDDVNYRLLLPAFVLMLAGLAANSGRRLSGRAQWALTVIAAAAVALVLAFQYCYVGRVSRKLQGIYEVISQAHLDTHFRDVAYSAFEPQAPSGISQPRLVPVHDVLPYLTDYWRTECRMPGRIFPTSIIRSTDSYSPLLGNIKKKSELPSAIVILGPQTQNRGVASLMPEQYDKVADTEYALILRRKARSAGELR